MNKVMCKSTGIVIGVSMALVGGAPALADDTELLLVTPSNASQPKPNVLFILDTSGSMSSGRVNTTLPYDANKDYSAFGACDSDKMYYAEDGRTPVCDSDNRMFVAKSSWHCDDSAIQIAGVGSYTGVLSQYRSTETDTTGDGVPDSIKKQWNTLEPGNSSDDVECQADAGLHGSNNVNTNTDVYPTNADSANTDGFTNDPQQSISWGSSGVNMPYTVFDGNYLNYKKDPTTQELSRLQVMKNATKTLLNSVKNMNVGIMRFYEEQGGIVIQAPIDLDANRAAIISRVDSLPGDGYTPMSETLFESALFWQGLPAHFAEIYGEGRTDDDALVSRDPEIYRQPALLSCSKNFNVLISDGLPTRDLDTQDLLGQLPNYQSVVGRAGCTGTGHGACLDDVGEYLANTDIHATLGGRQSVVTHTIGFTMDIPILEETALASGGKYLRADNTDELVTALTEVVSQINARTLSFSAPAVSVNTFNRTRNLNNVYITMFGARGAAHWPGNLKAYRIEGSTIVDAVGNEAVDPATGFFFPTARSFWTAGQADGNDVLLGGAANRLPSPANRRLFTDNGFDSSLSGASNAVSTANIDAFTRTDFGLTTSSTVTIDEMIRWMRGEDIKNEDGDPTTTMRNAMGDPLHARPATIIYGGTAENPEAVVYTATNDGYLHAVDAATGAELWSYVPKELLQRMSVLYDNPEMKYKLYGLDGDVVPVLRDVNRDGRIEAADGDMALILLGMRRGGSKFRMLDVTDKNNPVLVWERVLANGGESWSAPVVTRMDIQGKNQNEFKAVAVIGGGYDRVHDTPAYNGDPDLVGAGVHVLDLLTGATLWYAGNESSNADLRLSKMTKAIPTRVKVIDINGDSFADRMYAADLGGQIWRFDISNGNPAASLVAGGVIARLGAEGLGAPTAADTRRFYNSPDVAMFKDVRQNRRYISVSIGSGYRAHPLNLSAADRFYSIRDPNVFNSLAQQQYDNLVPFTESDLIEVSGKVNTTITSEDAGWKLTLPDNQMVLAESVTFNDEVFFVAFSPDSDSAAVCSAGQGSNFLYRVGILNGDPIMDDLGNIEAGQEDAARRTQLAQGGIAPTPQFLFPSMDDPNCTGADCNPPPIGCIGVECFDPGFVNRPVRTLWTQDGIE